MRSAVLLYAFCALFSAIGVIRAGVEIADQHGDPTQITVVHPEFNE